MLTLVAFLTTASAQEGCLDGRVQGVDTAGHCCWEGQAWNGQRCVGMPLACPDGMRVHIFEDECSAEACSPGQELVSGLYCCWKGQRWDANHEGCAGTPTCPNGETSDINWCGELPTLTLTDPFAQRYDPALRGSCPYGLHQGAGPEQCCTPGSAWSTPRSACVSGPVALGALDKKKIDPVIRAEMGSIQACYQRQLQKDRKLAGKVTIKFLIEPDGTVAWAQTKETTLHNSAVEDCICEVFNGLVYPAPMAGGVVIVSYPLMFAPG